MYTFNGGLSAPPLLSMDNGGGGMNQLLCTQLSSNNTTNNNSNTPRTPEILNSLIAMTNPLEYSYPAQGPNASNATTQVSTHKHTYFIIK